MWFLYAVRTGQNIGSRGSDLQAGHRVLPTGTWLSPARLGVIAALGLTRALVYARPRVAILCTGNEVIAPGHPLGPGRIYDVNTATLTAVVREHGGHPLSRAPVRDDRAAIVAAFDQALAEDLVLVSGGSSVGERDYILETIEARGDVRFEGIAVKPGMPTIFGMVNGRPVFGMPGNPTSCLSNAYILLAPALRRLARLPQEIVRSFTLPLGARVVSAPGRHQFYSVRVANGVAMPAFKASGDITSMSQADGYIEIAAEVEVVEAGTLVDVKLF